MEYANHLVATLFDPNHWCMYCEEDGTMNALLEVSRTDGRPE
jgi:hypothetical protein